MASKVLRVKEFVLDAEGRASHVIWDDNSREALPFPVDLTLQDHGGDQGEYWNYMNGQVDRYREIASKLKPGEPHEMQFENYQDYERAKEDWKDSESEQRMARAMGKALYARDEATKPPPVIDWDFLAATESPHEEDRVRGSEILSQRNLVQRLRADAARAEKEGNHVRARELTQMANYQELKANKDPGEYTFQREYNEGLAKRAVSELKSVEGKWQRGDPSYLRGLARAFNHESDSESSYDIRMSEDGQSFMVVSLEHSAQKARDIAKQGGDGERKLASLMRLRYPERPLEEQGKSLTLQQLAQEPDKMSQRQFEVWRETGKVFPRQALQDLNQAQFEKLRLSKGEEWPDGSPPQQEGPEELMPADEGPATVDQGWEASLKPYNPATQ